MEVRALKRKGSRDVFPSQGDLSCNFPVLLSLDAWESTIMAANGDINSGTRASFVRHMVRNNISKLLNRLDNEGKIDQLPGTIGQFGRTEPDHLPPRPDGSSQDLPPDAKMCIVGAGYAGLYSALILDHLGVTYDILEASPRPGGRVLTHYFSTRKHDYYDIGAMRFPNVPPMERYRIPSGH